MFKKFYPLALASALGVATFAAHSSSASAAALVIPQVLAGEAQSASDGRLQDARHRGQIHNYNRNDHGRRCRTRDGGCRHFHRGYYYETPWWTIPLIIGGAIASSDRDYYDDDRFEGRGNSRHVQWCFDRYRSYNPRYNTWVSYSGDERQCRSPFM
jgi:BA14K-like protein